MYQFVMSKDVTLPFTLSVCHPPSTLQLATMDCDSVVPYGNTLVMVGVSDASVARTVEMFIDSIVRI